MTDRLADLLLTPDRISNANLKHEGVDELELRLSEPALEEVVERTVKELEQKKKEGARN